MFERGNAAAARRQPPGWLHVITADAIVARPDFAERALEVVAALGSQGVFHLRARALTGRAYVALGQRLLDQSISSGTQLVINERVDMALAIGANAVQLGNGSLELAQVRRIAAQLKIGVSAHSETDVRSGSAADWIIFGHVFETQTHPGEPGAGLESLATVARAASTKVIAVGGISPERVAKVMTAGAFGVAVCDGIWAEPDPKTAVRHYLSEHGTPSFV